MHGSFRDGVNVDDLDQHKAIYEISPRFEGDDEVLIAFGNLATHKSMATRKRNNSRLYAGPTRTHGNIVDA